MGRDDAAAGEECAGSDELPDETWREITVAEGSQGPRSYMFSAQRVRVTRRQAWRGNGKGCLPPEPGPAASPADYLFVQRSRRHNVGDSGAYVGGSRWRIEPIGVTRRKRVTRLGIMDESRTPGVGLAGITDIAMCIVLGLQQNGGKRCRDDDHPSGHRCTGWTCGRCCPGSGSPGRTSCWLWLVESQLRNEQARRPPAVGRPDGAATLNPSPS